MHRSKRRCVENEVQRPRDSRHDDCDPLYTVMENVHKYSKDDPISTPLSATTLDYLNRIGITELLDQDLRPTFIIDLEDLAAREKGILRPVYCNPLLHTSRSLQELVLRKACGLVDGEELDGENDEEYKEFVSWAFQPVAAQARDASLLCTVFDSICWMNSTLRNRWRVVSGNSYALLPENKANAHTPSFLGHRRVEIHKSYTDHGLDFEGLVRVRESQFGGEACWEVSKEYPSLSAHMQLVLKTNWAATSFGAMETWSPQLHRLCNLLFAEPIPSILFVS